MVKVVVTMPDDLLQRVDREAERRGLTRSAILQEAARHELGWPDADAVTMDAAVDRARAALAGAGSFESVEAIRTGREGREAADRRR